MDGFMPKVPKPKDSIAVPEGVLELKAKLSIQEKQEDVSKSVLSNPINEEETLVGWIMTSIKLGIKMAPKMAKQLGIQLGVVFLINFIFWQIKPWQLSGIFSKIATFIIFFTATYNNVIPKTIYWVIVFTFGKRLVKRMAKEGFFKALKPLSQTPPAFKNALNHLEGKAYSLLLLGGGVGLVVANNFASYSRFSEARNKMDKYFVAIVISIAVSYILGESKKNGLVRFVTLAIQDLNKLLKRKPSVDLNSKVFILLTGFVMGLLLDAPLILMKFMYGGYIVGMLMICIGIVLEFVPILRGKGEA